MERLFDGSGYAANSVRAVTPIICRRSAVGLTGERVGDDLTPMLRSIFSVQISFDLRSESSRPVTSRPTWSILEHRGEMTSGF